MEQKAIKEKLTLSVENFRLPRYREIPDVGLYLEQCAKYISQVYSPWQDMGITNSMISNYVKKGLIKSPVKKQYDREQIAYLLFINAAKSVLSMDSIQTLMEIQQRTYSPEIAYDYFCSEFENLLLVAFDLKEHPDFVGSQLPEHPDAKALLKRNILTVVNKIYLDAYFALLSKE